MDNKIVNVVTSYTLIGLTTLTILPGIALGISGWIIIHRNKANIYNDQGELIFRISRNFGHYEAGTGLYLFVIAYLVFVSLLVHLKHLLSSNIPWKRIVSHVLHALILVLLLATSGFYISSCFKASKDAEHWQTILSDQCPLVNKNNATEINYTACNRLRHAYKMEFGSMMFGAIACSCLTILVLISWQQINTEESKGVASDEQ